MSRSSRHPSRQAQQARRNRAGNTVRSTVPALAITKTATASTTTPGSAIGYTITITNTSPTPYTAATITDDLSGLIDVHVPAAAIAGQYTATIVHSVS